MKCYIIILLNTVLYSQSTQTTKISELSKITAFETLEKLAISKESNRIIASLFFAGLGTYTYYAEKEIKQNNLNSTLDKAKYFSFGLATYHLFIKSSAEVAYDNIKHSESSNKEEMASLRLRELSEIAEVWRYVDVAVSGRAAYYYFVKYWNDKKSEKSGKTLTYIFLVNMAIEILIPSAEERYFTDYNKSQELKSSLSFNPIENKSIYYTLSINF